MRGVFVVWVVSFALATGVVASTTPAGAQSSGKATVKLLGASAVTRKLPLRDSAQKPYWVNRSDCLNHDVITYPVTMTGYSGLELQVWAGTVNCREPAQRTAGGGGTCWQVFARSYTQQEFAGGGFRVPLFARNLVAAQNRSFFVRGPMGAAEADASVCDAGKGSAPALALYFMLVDGTGTIPDGAVDVWSGTSYDITAPAPPTKLVVGAGEGHVNFGFSPSTDADVAGYDFFCDPQSDARSRDSHASTGGPGPDGQHDAGRPGTEDAGEQDGSGGVSGRTSAAEDSGIVTTDGGAPVVGGKCSEPSVLIAGVDPTLFVDEKGNNPYYCGHATGISVKDGRAEGLVNGKDYVVAIGAVDTVGNVGVLSAAKCGTPAEVVDFFELYKGFGGRGGCAISRTNEAPRWPLATLGIVVSTSVLRRRRRRLD